MSKFEDFGDLFNWNKELFEDDYNDGQKFVVKHKKKVGSTVSIIILVIFVRNLLPHLKLEIHQAM